MQTNREPAVAGYCVVIGLFVLTIALVVFGFLIAAANRPARAAEAVLVCMPQKIMVEAALEAGGEVYLITDPTEVARAFTFIIENNGTPMPRTDEVLYVVYANAKTSEVLFSRKGAVCGFNSADLAFGQKFWEFVKFKAGRPA